MQTTKEKMVLLFLFAGL